MTTESDQAPRRRAITVALPEDLVLELSHHASTESLVVSLGRGWHELVRSCHWELQARFPDYVVNAVKQKYGELAFQAWPRMQNSPGSGWPPGEWEAVDDITSACRVRSREVCENCGAPGGALRVPGGPVAPALGGVSH